MTPKPLTRFPSNLTFTLLQPTRTQIRYDLLCFDPVPKRRAADHLQRARSRPRRRSVTVGHRARTGVLCEAGPGQLRRCSPPRRGATRHLLDARWTRAVDHGAVPVDGIYGLPSLRRSSSSVSAYRMPSVARPRLDRMACRWRGRRARLSSISNKLTRTDRPDQKSFCVLGRSSDAVRLPFLSWPLRFYSSYSSFNRIWGLSFVSLSHTLPLRLSVSPLHSHNQSSMLSYHAVLIVPPHFPYNQKNHDTIHRQSTLFVPQTRTESCPVCCLCAVVTSYACMYHILRNEFKSLYKHYESMYDEGYAMICVHACVHILTCVLVVPNRVSESFIPVGLQLQQLRIVHLFTDLTLARTNYAFDASLQLEQGIGRIYKHSE